MPTSRIYLYYRNLIPHPVFPILRSLMPQNCTIIIKIYILENYIYFLAAPWATTGRNDGTS